ncbi:MAG: serine/threonine protein kinase [Myxococcota bacterium]|nr:serine/threonine protein kinase [Myxococcota bacterium]
MGRGLAVVGALLVVGGGAALGYGLTREAQGSMTPKATAAMTAAMTELDSEITKARSELRGGAEALARLTAVQSVIVADAETAKGSEETGELNFRPSPGVVIELGQIVDSKPTTLLVQPANGVVKPKNHAAGSYAELDGNTLAISEVVEVMPKSDDVRDGKKITGYIASSRSLDLTPLIAKLEDAQINGRLENAGKSRTIGKPDPAAKTEARTLPSQTTFQIIVDVPPARAAVPTGVVGASAGGAALGLLLIVIGLIRKKEPQVGIQSTQTVPSGPQSFANAPTKLSAHHSVASGTPVDSLSATGVSPANLGPGAMIGRWEVIRRLGSGGMADVYLAHSRGEAGFEKLVAIKVMHPHLARNERAVAHFLDEAKLAARIAHPNVVPIHDLGKIGNDYVIVMDYVEGVDLERLLASARVGGRPVPFDVGLGILCRICDGLNAAHRAQNPDGTPLGIIHRDVKSANVLVSTQGGVKVVDFGIAKAATQSHNTVAGETKGTPSMMAPEQRVGELVDVRADVYSVAAVGFEILTGHAVNLDLATLAHLGVENWPHLPLPSSLRAHLPPELDGILLTAMAYERERRPADCAAFEASFERVMKANGLSCSDKDIARWVDIELRQLVPAFQGASSSPVSRPAGA